VVLLGDVGQHEEVGEGARQRQRLGSAQRAQQSPQRLGRLDAARPGLLGQGPHPLDEREQLRTLLGAQGLAQQVAQQANVFPQAVVDAAVFARSHRRAVQKNDLG
jgi:hypothetical protein